MSRLSVGSVRNRESSDVMMQPSPRGLSSDEAERLFSAKGGYEMHGLMNPLDWHIKAAEQTLHPLGRKLINAQPRKSVSARTHQHGIVATCRERYMTALRHGEAPSDRAPKSRADVTSLP